MTGTRNTIEVEGVREMVAALRVVEPELFKAMKKEIRGALKDVQRGAEARYPEGKWGIRFKDKSAPIGQVATAGGSADRKRPWAEAPGGVRAAIFEFAGKRGAGATPQAQGLIEHLTEKYGSPGRFLWDSFDANADRVLPRIEAAVQAAEAEVQRIMDQV